ncbi:hypothetical protein ACLOJK_009153 [Asimina triloba]
MGCDQGETLPTRPTLSQTLAAKELVRAQAERGNDVRLALRDVELAEVLLSCQTGLSSSSDAQDVLMEFCSPPFLLLSPCRRHSDKAQSSPKLTILVHAVAVLKAGEDIITVKWGLNGTMQRGVDSQYKKVKVELCYAPISQQNRGWRKTDNELSKDKTCQHEIIDRPYTQSNKEESIDWMIKKDVPTATYFVRAYAVDASGKEVAYGQNTDKNKATNLFGVQGISGRHASLDIAAACFSAFAVVSLFGFFYVEKRKAKKSQGTCE